MSLEQRLARLEALSDEPSGFTRYVVDLGNDNGELLQPLEPGQVCIDLASAPAPWPAKDTQNTEPELWG